MCREIECYNAVVVNMLLEDRGVTNQNDMVVHRNLWGLVIHTGGQLYFGYKGFLMERKHLSTCLLMYIILTGGKIYY